MRRDSIFYRIFQQSPGLLFQLLPTPPADAAGYRFDAVAVKEPKFEIDGVFLPPRDRPGVVYFCEVQFQKDERLYERMASEVAVYFYQNRDQFADWVAVVIYPSRSLEQSDTHPYRALLASDQLHRIYLDELGDWRELPLGVALMVLTTLKTQEAPDAARFLLARSQQESPDPQTSRAIMEMLTTILVYKFDQLSRVEVEAMLGITLKQTRVYQEAKAEGEEIGEQRERSLILRLLTRRVGELPEPVRSRIATLSLEQLEALGEALLDFAGLADLQQWFDGIDAG